MPAPNSLARFALSSLCLLALTGCADNLARRDTIAFSSGNAVAANRAIQTIDPWPRGSYSRGQTLHGDKAAQAMRRYRTGDVVPPPAATVAITPGGGANGNGGTAP